MSVATCIVKNSSSSGARLKLHDPIFVPDEFDLIVPHKNAECRVTTRWREQEFVGVEIKYLYTSGQSPSLAQAHYIHRLKAENAALRRQMGLEAE